MSSGLLRGVRINTRGGFYAEIKDMDSGEPIRGVIAYSITHSVMENPKITLTVELEELIYEGRVEIEEAGR